MSVRIGNVLFPHSDPSTKSWAKTTVAKANKHRRGVLAKVRAVGKGKKKAEVQKTYLGSSLVRLSALVEAAKGLPYEKRLEIAKYGKIAIELQLHQPISEAVHFYLKEKSSGGFRCICRFGVRHRAAQKIVSDLVSAQFKPRAFQYNVAGRGVHKAVKAVRSYVASGFTCARRLDVKGFYDYFQHVALTKSGMLPMATIEGAVIGRHYTLVPDKPEGGGHYPAYLIQSHIDYLHSNGIPQGSACSPTIGNFYVSKLKFQLPKGARVLNYADDFLILAKSEEIREKATNTLKASIEALSVGKFELLEKSGSSIVSGFEFLGHWFEYDPPNKLHVRLTEANDAKQTEYFVRQEEQIGDLYAKLKKKPQNAALIELVIQDRLAGLAKQLAAWANTFSEVDDIASLHGEYLSVLEVLCEKIGNDFDKLISKAKVGGLQDVNFYSA